MTTEDDFQSRHDALTWRRGQGALLMQGDFLPATPVVLLPVNYGKNRKTAASIKSEVAHINVLVLTQSCDLEPRADGTVKVQNVVICPIFSLEEWEQKNPVFLKPGRWKEVYQGRHQGLYVLPPQKSDNSRDAFVVDFRQIFMIPYTLLSAHAASLEERWQLQSPFVEHLAQAFGLLFMRVGLPDNPLYELK